MVRDQALALSGLLSRKVGGPSVFPPQPDGLWQAAFNGQRTWATSQGEDRYRRGLYTFWRRTVPYPSMATFDAPSREICAIKRVRTNTPLQAFVTLNDPVYVEAAQALARRIVREGGSDVASRARYALQLCLCRPPRPEQVEPLVALYSAELERYRKDRDGRRGAGHRAARPAARRDGSGRPGRLDGRRQCALEPRRRLDQGLISMDSARSDLPLNLQQARAQTRRQFLKRSQTGLGGLALAMLLERDGRSSARGAEPVAGAPSADNPMAPRPPHFAPGRSASSTCTCPAARRSRTSSTTSPSWSSTTCSPAPTSCSRTRGSRSSRGIPSCSARRTSSSKCGQSGAVISELLPHFARRRRRRRHHQVDVDRPVQPRAGGAVPLHRLAAQRRGGDGLVDHLRPGLGEPGPARLRRADQRRHRPDRRQGALEHRLPAQRLPGRAVPDRGRPDPLRQRPQGHGPRRPPPDARRPAAAQRVRADRVRRPRDADADQPVRAGLPHADGGARRDGHPPGAGDDPRGVRGRTRARRRSPTTACWPAGWSSGACATSSSTTGAGTATAPAPATTSSSTCRRSARRSTGRSRRCSPT